MAVSLQFGEVSNAIVAHLWNLRELQTNEHGSFLYDSSHKGRSPRAMVVDFGENFPHDMDGELEANNFRSEVKSSSWSQSVEICNRSQPVSGTFSRLNIINFVNCFLTFMVLLD